jgi:hypothetical protein
MCKQIAWTLLQMISHICILCSATEHLRLVSMLISFTVPYLIASTTIAEEFEL